MDEFRDAELMEMVKAGDYAAFDELYNRYAEPIRRFLFQMTWDADIAEDLLQDTFLSLYRARCRYQPTGKFSTFIFQIAKNHCLSAHRKTTSESRVEVNPFENIRSNPRIEPEVHLIEGYMQFRIRRAIARLSENQRTVFVLSHFEDMKYAEIAELLNIPVGTVKSRMHAAVTALKSQLQEDYP